MANENKLHGAEAKNAWESISGASQAEILRELGLVPRGGTPPSDYVSSSTGGTTETGGTNGTTETVTVTTHTPTSRSDNLTGLVTDAYGNINTKYTDLFDKIMNTDPTETDWGKTILNYYGIQSLADANGVRGSGAADNAGNVDSYAAANAARQRLSTLNQGINAVSGMAKDRWGAALDTLSSLGVNTKDILGVEAGNVESSYGHDASLYNTNKTLEGNKYVADQNLEGIKDTNKTNKDIAEMGGTSSSPQLTTDAIKAIAAGIKADHPNGYPKNLANIMIGELMDDFGISLERAKGYAYDAFDVNPDL